MKRALPLLYVPVLMLSLLAQRPAAAQSAASSVTLNPATLAGGQSATGTVTLSAPAPAEGAVVALESSSHGAWVPSYVGIPAGLSSADFPVVTSETTATAAVTIYAYYGGATASAVLTINPTPGAQTDTVSNVSAQYEVRKKRLKVEARSTSNSASLGVYVTSTGELIGTLSNKRGGRYQGQFSWPSNPGSITIVSTLGGSATAGVTNR